MGAESKGAVVMAAAWRGGDGEVCVLGKLGADEARGECGGDLHESHFRG